MERRLAAILAADVVGYSRLIREDEAGTLAALKVHREQLIEPKVAERKGRIVKLMGDGLLIEFPSAVEAVQCAVEIQHLIGERNADVPEEKRIVYRIGINIGDIVVEDDDIYGDGVNVAARLEGLAEPSGICVARNVFNQVKDKLDLTIEHLGDHEVKNIAELLTVYRVALDDKAAALVTPVVQKAAKQPRRRLSIAAAVVVLVLAAGGVIWWQPWAPEFTPVQVEKMAFPLPDKPSIAVLPFANLSGDPEQEYFSDGITNDIITGLSKFSTLFIIASNSTFRYKGKPTKVQDVARDLGVRYVLEGSVQRAGDVLRINVQLIDATTGQHVWAENYERSAQDLFAVQKEVMQNIIGVIGAVAETGGGFHKAEIERIARKPTDSLEAYDFFLRGIAHMNTETKEDALLARQLFEEATELDPRFARAFAENSQNYLDEIWGDWTNSRDETLHKAEMMALRAIELDNSEPHGYLRLGFVYQFDGRIEEAISMWKKAHALNTNDYNILYGLGYGLAYTGQPDTGIPILETAQRVNPYHSEDFIRSLGQVYFLAGRYQDAIETFGRITRRHRTSYWLYLAASQAQLDRIEDARAAIAEALKLKPNLSLAHEIKRRRDNGLSVTGAERLREALRKAGLPE
jgi:adenylate cyclase